MFNEELSNAQQQVFEQGLYTWEKRGVIGVFLKEGDTDGIYIISLNVEAVSYIEVKLAFESGLVVAGGLVSHAIIDASVRQLHLANRNDETIGGDGFQ